MPLLLHKLCRKHATLRCYLDMERFVKPKVHELEALLKNGDVDSERAKRVRECVYGFESGLPE